jgi:hypothetical protein
VLALQSDRIAFQAPVLAEVAKLGAKIDAITTAHQEHARDIKAQRHDDDIRIATLEQQVNSLQDAAT